MRVSPQQLKKFHSPRHLAGGLPSFLEAKNSHHIIPEGADSTLNKTAEFPNKQYDMVSPPRRRISEQEDNLGHRQGKMV